MRLERANRGVLSATDHTAQLGPCGVYTESLGFAFMKTALLGKEGGVGKSTVFILLYEAFRQAGKSVVIRSLAEVSSAAYAARLAN